MGKGHILVHGSLTLLILGLWRSRILWQQDPGEEETVPVEGKQSERSRPGAGIPFGGMLPVPPPGSTIPFFA